MPNSAKMPKGNSNPFKHPEKSLNPPRTPNRISIVGWMGCDNIQNNPSVPNVALSATSNQMTSKTSHSVSCSNRKPVLYLRLLNNVKSYPGFFILWPLKVIINIKFCNHINSSQIFYTLYASIAANNTYDIVFTASILCLT